MDIQAANMLYANGVPDIVGPFPFDKAGVRWGQDAGTYTGGNYFPTDAFRIAKDPQCANTSIVAASLAANCNLGAIYDATTGQALLVHPLPGNRGTLGRRVIRGVTVPSFDMNVAKSFRISESKSVQLRIDASNVLNHPVPNTPQLSLAPSAATNALNTSFGQILKRDRFFDYRREDRIPKGPGCASVQLLGFWFFKIRRASFGTSLKWGKLGCGEFSKGSFWLQRCFLPSRRGFTTPSRRRLNLPS